MTLKHEQSEADRIALARLDPNPFNRWRILNDLLGETLAAAAESSPKTRDPLSTGVVEAIVSSAGDDALDPAFRVQILAVPGEAEVARLIGRNVDPDAVFETLNAARQQIANEGAEVFARLVAAAPADETFSPDAQSAGRRALANGALGYLCLADRSPERAAERFRHASNMTDRQAALTILAFRFPEAKETEDAFAAFYDRHQRDDLVLDKWFAIQAAAPGASRLEKVNTLLSHPRFTLRNPNRARSLIGSFAGLNPVVFHRADGAGYAWVADRLTELDAINPQISARLATAFRAWRTLEPTRRKAAEATLRKLAAMPQLSTDLKDIVDRTLA